MGADQNIDLLKAQEHSGTGYFVDMNFSYGVAPTVTRPTRITHKSATLIDNFYISSSLLNVAKTRIIVSDISDHFPILLQITGERSFKSKPLTFTARKFNETSVGQIKEHLGAHTWDGYENYTAEQCFENAIKTIHDAVDLHAPEKRVVIPSKHVIKEP